MKKIDDFFKLPVLEDFYDYRKSVHFAFFAVYAVVMFSFMTFSPNPANATLIAAPLMFFILLYLYRKVLLNDIKLFKKHYEQYITFSLAGAVLIIALNFLGNFINVWIEGAAPNQDAAVEAFWRSPILMAAYITIVVPISEELMFRRAIRGMTKSKLVYYSLSALLFGLAHIIINFEFPYSFAFIFTYALPGLGFAFIYDKSKNIYCPIFTHLIINVMSVIGLIFT